MAHKNNGVDKFGNWERWVGSGKLIFCGTIVLTPVAYHRRVIERARNVASFPTGCTTMVCGQVFRIMA